MNDSEALNRALTMAEDWKKRAEESDKQNQDLQAQIQKLSSDKQKLSEALKQRNKDLQNLNAQLVKLKGADKVLQENNQLKLLNDQLSHSIQVTKAEADEAKQKAQDSLRSSQEAQRAFLAKTKSIDQLINQKASERTREAKNELEINYQSMTKQTKAILAIPTVYSLVLTLVLLFKLPHIWRDCWHVLRDLVWFFWKPTVWLFHISANWWGWLHWTLPALTLLALAGLLIGILLFFMVRISEVTWRIFPDVITVLVLVAIILVFGPLAQQLLPWVNLAWVLIVVLCSYLVLGKSKD